MIFHTSPYPLKTTRKKLSSPRIIECFDWSNGDFKNFTNFSWWLLHSLDSILDNWGNFFTPRAHCPSKTPHYSPVFFSNFFIRFFCFNDFSQLWFYVKNLWPGSHRHIYFFHKLKSSKFSPDKTKDCFSIKNITSQWNDSCPPLLSFFVGVRIIYNFWDIQIYLFCFCRIFFTFWLL